MSLSSSDPKIKILMKEVLIEMLEEKNDLFYEAIVEAIEDVALANAIAKGRENKFVDEDKILSILKS